ncbi:MAG: hypothetical protein ABSA76_10440 [Bacteroidales bacterium]
MKHNPFENLKWLLLPVLLIILNIEGFAQQFTWHEGLFSFFDNTEFGKSKVKIPQTMAGVMLIPEIGLTWDSVHLVSTGVNLMHEFGSPEPIGRFYPTAYYNYNKGPFKFAMGAFPRALAVENYPRIFFQDSISYYRPNINGIFVGLSDKQNFLSLWLDWTGRQSTTVHEAFFVGMSGRYNIGIFYVQHYDYYFHYAMLMNPVVDEALHDNALFLTSAGINLSGKLFLNKLEANAGWVGALERARAENTGWIFMNGLFSEIRAEYRCIGLFNTFYTGHGLMYFYNNHGNNLYWGDPIYRAKTSDRLDAYLDFIRSSKINLEMTYSLHFLEGRIYHEQMLKLKVNLDGRVKN